jgi:hypothetical protein
MTFAVHFLPLLLSSYFFGKSPRLFLGSCVRNTSSKVGIRSAPRFHFPIFADLFALFPFSENAACFVLFRSISVPRLRLSHSSKIWTTYSKLLFYHLVSFRSVPVLFSFFFSREQHGETPDSREQHGETPNSRSNTARLPFLGDRISNWLSFASPAFPSPDFSSSFHCSIFFFLPAFSRRSITS